MLANIEVNSSFGSRKTIEAKKEKTLKSTKKITAFRLDDNILLEKDHLNKITVPIKEYSNKFLREAKPELHSTEEHHQVHHRLNSIMKKGKKLYHQKYQKIISKRFYYCKTEPSQSEYKCFTTPHQSKHHQPHLIHNVQQLQSVLLKKQNTSANNIRSNQKQQKALTLNDQDDLLMSFQQNSTPHYSKNIKLHEIQKHSTTTTTKKTSGKDQIHDQGNNWFHGNSNNHNSTQERKQKISTSRGLEIYSKVILKEKGQVFYQKVKLSNQKKLINEKIKESNRNLQTKQITLHQKQKKIAWVQKKLVLKQHNHKVKIRGRIKSDIENITPMKFQEQNFELNGWDTTY